MRATDYLWYGDDAVKSTLRMLLAPAEWMYSGTVRARNALYDRGLLPTNVPIVPALSVGNVSIGGTGKTPVAAWAAAQLQSRGAHPAIVLRGYGNDETLVHARLNPGIAVVTDADRMRGAADAARGGADCVVFDDAFQHRGVGRVADWVLVSTEQWRNDARQLPAGPLRESESSLSRATVVIVTRKTAALSQAEDVAAGLAARFAAGPPAIMNLMSTLLVGAGGESEPVARIEGRRYVAVAAIGAADTFYRSLRMLGATIEETSFGDHHDFTMADVRSLVRRATRTDGIICTLKDAVKLAPLWRGAYPPLWYVSQTASVDCGNAQLLASVNDVLAARACTFKNAGLPGPSSSANGHRSPTADR